MTPAQSIITCMDNIDDDDEDKNGGSDEDDDEEEVLHAAFMELDG